MEQEITKEGGSVADVTTSNPTGSVTEGVTTPAVPSDVTKELERLRAELSKREEDINRLKSSSQKREAKLQKDTEQKLKSLEDQLRKIQLSVLPEDKRKEAEAEIKLQEAEVWKSRAEQLQAEYEAVQERQNYVQFFKEKGVPDSALNAAETTEDLLNAGWSFVINELDTLRQQVKAAPKQEPQKQTPTPPPVATTSQGLPKSGPSWDDLVKKYGSMEEVYSRVESGQLPSDIIPK